MLLSAALTVPSAAAASGPFFPPGTRPPPAPEFPSGCEPEIIHSRLASPDSAEVARACGNLRLPWGYRGWRGRHQALRSYGRRVAGADWARSLAMTLLDSTALDTIYRVPGLVASCKPAQGPPIYLVRLHRGDQSTSVLLRFDLGVAALFADEAPLGMIVLGERADSLWALLAQVLEDDPTLRRARPEPADSIFATPHAMGEAVAVDTPPVQIGRGRDAPEYPEQARRQGIQGTVHVLVRVDTKGEVEDAVVLAGPELLRDSALETVWGMRFKPARAGGVPVAAWTMVPATYRVH